MTTPNGQASITVHPGSEWSVSARECGTEFGGDHHIYVDVLGVDGLREKNIPPVLVNGIPYQYERKPDNEPLFNIPMFTRDRTRVKVGDAEVTGLSTNFGKTDLGDWFHHSFYVVFRRKSPQPEPPTQVHTGDDERMRKLAELITKFCSDALAIIGQ